MRKIIIGFLVLLLVGVSVGATSYMYDGFNEWEGGETNHCCASGYCYTLVNAECSEEMWNRAICTKYRMCRPGVEKLVDVEGVETE